MNKIFKYKDIIIIEDTSTVSGYKRPVDVKTMKFLKAGSAATYEKFSKDWVEIGELYKTHIIKDGCLVCISSTKKSKSSNATTINRSISLPIPLVEKLDKIAEDQERPFSWIIQKLILKGLGDDKTK
nr:MAG TPA: Transcriptional regulator, RHH-like, CopG [Caudoviricetes sp.]